MTSGGNMKPRHKRQKNVYKQYASFFMFICFLLMSGIILTGCEKKQEHAQEKECHVVFEDNDGFVVDEPVRTVIRGEDLVFSLTMKDGYALRSVDYPESIVQAQTASKSTSVTLKNVRYSVTVKADVAESDLKIMYDANGGVRLDGQDRNEPITIAAWNTHMRVNTSKGTDLFQRDGYTMTGWNTSPDGSGESVGLGSRIDAAEGMCLYAQWSKWTDESCFTYEMQSNNVVITGYNGDVEVITIPTEIENRPVIAIGKDAFAQANCKTVILPLTLQTIASDAFIGATMESVYLFDNIVTFDDYSFRSCKELRTLHINAVEDPVYSNNYFATFADKYDRLLSIKNEKKIVLFSGSSSRFGYDSEKIEQAFPDHKVVNMGVFAYTNASPQMMLILNCMQEADILIDAPEFDAAKRQFCTTADLDDSFFCMVEANYDILSELDLRMFQKTFSSFHSYLTVKAGMEAKNYNMTPSEFDEDGEPVRVQSYNIYGDYILDRPNASEDKPIYGLAVPYTREAFPKETYIDPVNDMYQHFLDKGIHVYFTYAPRNKEAISSDSTLDKRRELDTYFRENLIVPVISDIEESLYPGRYLYGTDNHLSTQGVQIRTQRIISDLTQQMNKEGQADE